MFLVGAAVRPRVVLFLTGAAGRRSGIHGLQRFELIGGGGHHVLCEEGGFQQRLRLRLGLTVVAIAIAIVFVIDGVQQRRASAIEGDTNVGVGPRQAVVAFLGAAVFARLEVLLTAGAHWQHPARKRHVDWVFEPRRREAQQVGVLLGFAEVVGVHPLSVHWMLGAGAGQFNYYFELGIQNNKGDFFLLN